jgi:hypothetical protein
VLAQEAVRALDEGNPGWRSQTTATVRIPVSQVTDDPGLQKLRREVADVVLPAYQRNRSLNIKLRVAFPRSAAGLAQSQALRDALDRGIPCTIQGEYVAEVVHPDWFERLYGDALPAIEQFTVAPKPPDTVFDALAEVRAHGILESFPLRLRVQRAGRKEVELVTDDSTRSPISLKMLFRLGDPTELVLGLSVDLRVGSARLLAPVLRLFSEYEKGTPIRILVEDGEKPLAVIPPGELPLPETLSQLVEATEHLVVLEKYAVLERPINLEWIDDTTLALLRFFAKAVSTGEIVEKVSAQLGGVRLAAKDDANVTFNFDRPLELMDGTIRLVNTQMVPEDDRWRETAVVEPDGTLSVEVPSFRLVQLPVLA